MVILELAPCDLNVLEVKYSYGDIRVYDEEDFSLKYKYKVIGTKRRRKMLLWGAIRTEKGLIETELLEREMSIYSIALRKVDVMSGTLGPVREFLVGTRKFKIDEAREILNKFTPNLDDVEEVLEKMGIPDTKRMDKAAERCFRQELRDINLVPKKYTKDIRYIERFEYAYED